MKKLILLSIFMLVVALGISIYIFNKTPDVSDPSNFKVTVLDVGKADSILLNIDDKNVLIDAGENENGQDILTFLRKNNVTKIDHMIITHFDKDHVGGADILIDNLNIGNVIQPTYEKSSKHYTRYINALNKKNIKPVSLKETMSFNLNGVEFTIYPPKKASYVEGDNDFSLVTSVKHQNNSFLFAGDAESERLQELLSQGNLSHTFLKVPHHGKYNNISKDFISAVSPKYAAITCSKKNPPDEKLLNILESLKTKTYLTQNGNINILSDGNTIKINQ